MTESEKYKLSTYQSVELLHKTDASVVELVECSLDEKKYIKKSYHEDKRNLFDVLKKLESPFLPKIYDVFFCEDTIVIEECIEGVTLENLIERSYEFNKKAMLALLECISLAMITLCEAGIVHRDIKPSNIMVKENGDAVLIDFSISRLYSKLGKSDTELLGTVGYAAPEQFGFSQSDYRTDIYSLGITLKGVSLAKNVPKYIVKAINRCAEFDPANRFQTAVEIRKYIKREQKKKLIIPILIFAVLVFMVVSFAICMPKNKDQNVGITENASSHVKSEQLQEDTQKENVREEVIEEVEEAPEQEEIEKHLPEDTEKPLTLTETEREPEEMGISDSSVKEIEVIITEEKNDEAQMQQKEEEKTPMQPQVQVEDLSELVYEPLSSRIVGTSDATSAIPCLQMLTDNKYKTKIALSEDVEASVEVVSSDGKYTITVNDKESFVVESTYTPENYDYPNGKMMAEIIFYDMNGDGVLEIIPVLSNAAVVQYQKDTEVAYLRNYSYARCIYFDGGRYRLASGEMIAKAEKLRIFATYPGCIMADFPSYYKLVGEELVCLK